LRKIVSNLHYVCTALLALLAVPAIQHLHLPTRINWRSIILFYWVTLGSRSILYAMAFCVLGLALRQSIGLFVARYRKEKLRVGFALSFLAVLHLLLPVTTAIVLTVDALFIVELAERRKLEKEPLYRKAASIFVTAAYLFFGVTLVMTYNDIIVVSRFPVSYDAALNRIDTSVLWGHSVSSIAHNMFAVLPPRLLSFLDFAYFQMFFVMGGTLFVSAYTSCKRGLQFAGACLTAYYLTLLIFYIWPTYGPYIYCNTHAAEFPRNLTSYIFQTSGMPGLQAIAQRKTQYLATGYFIAFPSMHIGLPAIAMWFMGRWRRVFWFLAAYTCVVSGTVVILEWHYAVDILGGLAVAAIALAIANPKLAND
jgi:hypothetical protein